MRHVEHARFIEIITDDLQPDRQAATVKPAGDRHAGQSGQIHRDGVDVRQIHLHRITAFFADAERGGRAGRPHDHIAVPERGDKILRDQPAQFLCADVIGVVITVRQHIGADQDAALDLGAETFAAAAFVHVEQIGVFGGAMAVTHAIKTRQVARGFGRSQHVIHGHRQTHVGQADVNDRGTEFFVFGAGRFNRFLHIGRHSRRKKFFGQTDAQPFERFRQIAVVIFGWPFEAGRIAPVMAGHHVEQQAEVFGSARHRTGLIQAGSERDHAVTRHQSVSGLQSADAGERGGLADRAASVGAGRRRCEPRSYRSGRTAGAAAGHPLAIPRIAHCAEIRGLVRRTHRELVHVGLAQRDHAGGITALDHMCVVRCNKIGEHFRAAGGQPALRTEDVLVRQRHPGQRPGIAGGAARIRGLRLGQRPRRIDGHVTAEVFIQDIDFIDKFLREFNAGAGLGSQLCGQFFNRGVGHCWGGAGLRRQAWLGLFDNYSMTLGTR